MKIEGYTVQFNTSATNYRGQLIEAVPYWRLYSVDRSDRHNPIRTSLGTYSLHELQLYFRSIYDNKGVLAPKHSFEAYARASRRVNRKRNSLTPEELKKKVKQLERKLKDLE